MAAELGSKIIDAGSGTILVYDLLNLIIRESLLRLTIGVGSGIIFID